MADYPAVLPVYNTHKFTDNVTEVNAANSNYWWQELVNICTELGINPKGAASDLVTRLAISLELNGQLKLYQTCTSVTRPASPPEGMLIYETNTKKFYKCTTGGGAPVWAEIATLSEVLLLAGGTMTGALNMGGFAITNLLDPVLAGDAATRGWVETLLSGIKWQEVILDRDLSTPPGAIAGRYIVKATGLGLWAGHDNDIADGHTGTWVFTSEGEGMACYVDDENIFVYFDGSAWVKLASGIGTITQAMVQPDATEATTWDASITSLLNNLNRIRNQILAITGEAWGTVSHSIATIWGKFHETTGHKHSGIAGDAPNVPWANLSDKPSSSVANIDSAVSLKHTRKHDINGTDDHNGVAAAVENNFISFTAVGLPKDSGKKAADFADKLLATYPISFSAVFAAGYTGNLHFQLIVSANADLSAPVVNVESKDSQTNWIYDNGVQWVAVPAGGVDVIFDGHRVAFKVLATLNRGTLYYLYIRQYQVGNSAYENPIFGTLVI